MYLEDVSNTAIILIAAASRALLRNNYMVGWRYVFLFLVGWIFLPISHIKSICRATSLPLD